MRAFHWQTGRPHSPVVWSDARCLGAGTSALSLSAHLLIRQIAGLLIALAGAQISIAAVIVPCIVFDLGLQMGQVSNASRVANIDPQARARLNSCYILSLFLGQVRNPPALSCVILTPCVRQLEQRF